MKPHSKLTGALLCFGAPLLLAACGASSGESADHPGGTARAPSCDLDPVDLPAELLTGGRSTLEEACAAADLSSCKALGPTMTIPGDEAAFSRLMVISGTRGDGDAAAVAVELGERWYVSRTLGAMNERAVHDGPIVLDENEEGGEMAVITLRYTSDSTGSPVRERYETVLCSSGASGVPSCVTTPESFLSADQEVADETSPAVRLHILYCGDGTVVFSGDPDWLPSREAALFASFIGRRHLVFP